jgi:hypothetical protein
MMKRKICGFFLLAFLIVAANAYADQTLRQKINGAWECSETIRHGAKRAVLKLDFQKHTFEETFYFDEALYKKRLEVNPELTRELLQPKQTGTFKIVSETGDSLICDFFYDQGLAITLDLQDNGDLKFLGGMALPTRAEAVKHQDKFLTLTPQKGNNGLDGIWVTRISGRTMALIIKQAQKPKPEMILVSAESLIPESDVDWYASGGHRIDGDLVVLNADEGLTSARFDKWRTRETLTLNADGTLFIASPLNNDNVYTRVEADQ